MLETIEGIEEPEPGATVWRFMDFTKYVSMLHRRALFFARADQLLDPFEGEYARRGRAPRPRDRKHECLYERIFVSCWHGNDHESAAMWRIYLSGEGGVAIRSTAERLRAALSELPEPLAIGTVRYLDYDRDAIPEGDERAPFFCKRQSFDYEREVRVLWKANDAVDEPGRYLSVDLQDIIDEVKIAPTAEPWFQELICSVTERYGLKLNTTMSSLADTPQLGLGVALSRPGHP